MTKLSETNGYYRTDNATATGADIATGKTAYIAGGQVTGTLSLYTPAMMEFDGSTGYYSQTLNFGGTGITAIARFICGEVAGASQMICFGFGSTLPLKLEIIASDAGSNPNKLLVGVKNSANSAYVCQLYSTQAFNDGTEHTVFFSYNGATGTAIFIVDGVNADDTGNGARILTTGTLGGTAIGFGVGGTSSGTALLNGQVGYFGVKESYLTNWQDFMYTDGSPKALDETTWTEWGAQPLFWNEHGDMENNLGSAGAMTKNGTIVVGKGGN